MDVSMMCQLSQCNTLCGWWDQPK